MITSTTQQHISSKIRLGAAGAALTLVVVLGLGAVTTASAQAPIFDVLYSFTGSPDGETPKGDLVRDKAGTLYGTTYYGGSSNLGTVFAVYTSGKEAVLYSFTGGADGANPIGGVILDTAGNLYGTTQFGGSSGRGTVWQITK